MANLLKLAQIHGGVQLQADVTKLLVDAYDATKQLTVGADLVKAAQGVEGQADYVAAHQMTVNEALGELAAAISAINGNGDGSDSLSSIATAVKGIKEKKVKDVVREYAQITVTAGKGENAALVYGLTTTAALAAIPGIQSGEVNLYTADNRIIVDATGNAIKAAVTVTGDETKVVSIGLPAGAVPHVMEESGKYAALTAASEVKFFVEGEWQFIDLPANALLDNEELSLIAYSNAINKIVVQMANNKVILDKVVEAIGSEVVDKIVEDKINGLGVRVFALEEKALIPELTQAEGESDEAFATRKATAIATAEVAAVKGADVVKSVRVAADASDEKIATEKAVRTAIDAVSTTVSGNDSAIKARVEALEAGFGLVKGDEESDEAFAARQAKATVKVADVATEILTEGSSDSKVASQKAVADAVATAKEAAKNAQSTADLAKNNINKMTEALKDLQNVAVMITERVLKGNIVAAKDGQGKITSETITLANVPNSRMVFMTVNGLEYNEKNSEGEYGQFAVTRPAEGDAVLTWDATKIGFSLSEVVDDYVIVKYYSGKWKSVTLDTELVEYATKGYVDSIITIEEIDETAE